MSQHLNYVTKTCPCRGAILKLSNAILFLSRAWFYFRLGYATYLTFLLGYISTLITVYYLAIKNLPDLLNVFPRFVPFAILATVIGVPFSIVVGWFHLKRSSLFSSEADISVESNPWNYKLPPGYAKEVFYPLLLAELKILRKLAQKELVISDAEKNEWNKLEEGFQILLDGGYLGNPRRKMAQ
jgi:hypothetical protein